MTRKETTMSEAFSRAGVVLPGARLLQLAAEAVAAFPRDMDAAVRRLNTMLLAADDAALERALNQHRERDIRELLSRVAAESLRRELKRSNGGAGQSRRDDQTTSARSAVAAEPARDGGGHTRTDDHWEFAPAAPAPKPSRVTAAAAEAAGESLARSLLDTFTVNGLPLGDLDVTEALAWGAARETDARFIRLLTQGMPPVGKIRDYATAESAAEAMRLAKEAANANE